MEKILEEIKSKASFGIHPGLENITELCAELGNPQRLLKCIHVAGTNGKGSVCAYIEAVLNSAKIKTGCYTSPCVFEKNEQFRINAENCSSKIFEKAARITLNAVDKLNAQGVFPSEFEIETAIAFEIFYLEKCDICIIECGMGGAFDATDVIENPLVCVLTSIDCDHGKFLGKSIAEITENKCGIIKQGSLVISAVQNDEADAVIAAVCEKMHARRKYTDTSKICINDFSRNNALMRFEYCGSEYESKMLGIYQAFNAALAIEVCKALNSQGFNIVEKDLKCGVAKAQNPGRFEILSRSPFVICDGAHNKHGAIFLKNSLKAFFGDEKITLVMGVFKDKDYDGILKIMSECSDTLYALAPENSRALEACELKNAAQKYFRYTFETNVEKIPGDIVENGGNFCIFGSLSYLNSFKNSFLNRSKA